MPAAQNSPVFMRPPTRQRCTDLAKSQSSKTMLADLPPSSRVAGTRRWAAATLTFWPTPTDPVNEIFLMSGWSSRRCPQVAESPTTTLSTPAGKMSWASFAKMSASSGVELDGRYTTVLPVTSAAPTFIESKPKGMFHAEMSATGPSG